MPASKTLTKLRDEIRQQKLRLIEIESAYITQLYLETMPEYDPLYKYCFQTSNRTIPGEYYSVEHWLRAVAIHMSRRHSGHGGGIARIQIVAVPNSTSQQSKDEWLEHETAKLSRRVRVIKPRKPKTAAVKPTPQHAV